MFVCVGPDCRQSGARADSLEKRHEAHCDGFTIGSLARGGSCHYRLDGMVVVVVAMMVAMVVM